jgi:hypothetical protein
MQHWLVRFHAFIFSRHHMWTEDFLALVIVLFVFVSPASAAMRFQERSLFMNTSEPGATTSYLLSFRYMDPDIVGSVDMQYCINPIPYEACVPPPGLDVSHAVLSNQTGETGFSISSQTTNHIIISRAPTAMATGDSSYKFDNIKNPTDTSTSFSIRLRSHASTDATGPLINFGSVKGQVQNGIAIETQVPPMLIFCVAGQVDNDCTTSNNNYYTDMGELSSDSTLTAQSEMMVGTNATAGFVITANGTPMAAGTNIIDSLPTPTASTKGDNQFGINLVANNAPTVGNDPEGTWANAVTSPDYSIPNQYKFVPGDVVAYSPSVSLMKKFTVSYIVNSSPDLRAGVYTTTITYIASGRF